MKTTFILLTLVLSISAFSQSDWTVYNTNNSDISGNNVWNVTCDGIHVYISTNGYGLDYKFGSNWYQYNVGNSDLPDNEVSPVYIDPFGKIWIGTDGGGIGVLDANEWTLYSTQNSDLGDNIIYDIEYDGSSMYWVATRFAGIHSYNGSEWTQYNTWPNTTSLAIDPNSGVIWAGTYNGGPGLMYYENGQWNNFSGDLPNNDVYFLDFDSDGSLWIGTFGGLAKYSNGILTTWTTDNSPLPDNYIRQVAFDPNGGVWIATGNGGVARMEGDEWVIWDNTNSTLPSNKIWSVEVQDENHVWVGMFDNGGAAVLKYSDYPEIGETKVDESSTQQAGLFVFPNPSSGFVKIEIPTQEGSLEILDEEGRIVHSENVVGGPKTIELDLGSKINLTSSIYFVRFTGNGIEQYRRLIILK